MTQMAARLADLDDPRLVFCTALSRRDWSSPSTSTSRPYIAPLPSTPPIVRIFCAMASEAPRFFSNTAGWRKWLEKNHAAADELWVGFHKKGSGKPSITWLESVDQVVCFGWIDGLRKGIDEDSYKIRFTPDGRGASGASSIPGA
jgi:hypothetical protein